MTVSYGWRGVAIRTPVGSPVVPRLAPFGPAALSRRGPEAPALWRGCDVEGYLQRKLHRQWRNRGS